MSNIDFGSPDVVVIGAGNAACCAPLDDCGGNSRYTAGAVRIVFNSVDDLVQLYDLTDDEKKNVDFGTYTEDQYFDDMGRITNFRTDPDLCEILVKRSFETMVWMRKKGVKFQPSYGRQAFKVNGRFKFWGGLAV